MAKKKKETKKKCCGKFIKKGKQCGKCPIVETCTLEEKVVSFNEKKKKKDKKKTKKDSKKK